MLYNIFIKDKTCADLVILCLLGVFMSLYENHLFSSDLPIIFHQDHLNVNNNKSCISNYHENIELLYCVEGCGKVVINSNAIDMHKGNLILINSGDIHYTITETQCFTYYCLIIYSDFLKKFGIDVEELHFVENVTDECGKLFFKKIIHELTTGSSYYNVIAIGEIISYMGYLCRKYKIKKVNTKNDTMIKMALIYIRKHYKEDLSVDHIASHTGFSRYYFSRQFKEITGMTVTEYIRFIRCRHAHELLSEGNYSVSKAAMECGFTDLSYFTKVFKRQTGVLPSAVALSAQNNPKPIDCSNIHNSFLIE